MVDAGLTSNEFGSLPLARSLPVMTFAATPAFRNSIATGTSVPLASAAEDSMDDIDGGAYVRR